MERHNLLIYRITARNFCSFIGRGVIWLRQNIVLQNVGYLNALKELFSTRETESGADGQMKTVV